MTPAAGPDLRDRPAIEAADVGGLLPAAGTAGAQLRVVAGQLDELGEIDRPRAMVVVGSTASVDGALLAALAGDRARTPVIAVPSLPAWVGPLDLVVVLADRPDDEPAAVAAATALHRGARTVVRGAADGPVALAAGACLLPPVTAVPEALAVAGRWALLAGLAARCGLLPHAPLRSCADLLDQVSLGLHPSAETFLNPAVNLAEYLLDGTPLFVGADQVGDALAAQAASVFGELAGIGSAVLGARAAGLTSTLLAGVGRDVFDDPFDDGPPVSSRPAVRAVLLSTLDPTLPSADAARLSALRRALPTAMHLDGMAAGAGPDSGSPSDQSAQAAGGAGEATPWRGGDASARERWPGPSAPADPWRPQSLTTSRDALSAALVPAVQLGFAAVYAALAVGAPLPGDYPDGLGRSGGTRWAVRPATVEQRRDDDLD